MKIKVFLSLLFIGFGILFCVILLINHLKQHVTDREQELDKFLSRNDNPPPRIPRTVEIPDDIRQKFATVPERPPPTLIAEFVHGDYMQSVKFSPTNHNLVLSMTRTYNKNNEKNIKLWDINNPTTPLAEFSGDSVSYSPDGKILAISKYRGIEDNVKFWDIAEEKFISSISVPGWYVVFSPNGKHLAVETLGLELWDVSNPTMPVEVIKLKGENIEDDHTFSADGKLMATRESIKDIVNIWEIDGNQVIKRESIEVKKFKWIEVMKFSPNLQNPILAIAGNDEGIRLYHPPDWQNYTVLPAGNVNDLVFTSDGSTIISGGTDELEFWSVDNGNRYTSIEGYSRWIKCVDVSADSRYVAGGGNDGIIRVWDITNFLPSRQSNIPSVVVPIYFLPTNRLPQTDIPEKIDKILKDVQTFFADEMERHGYGRKSFEFEKNSNGSAKVYLFEGNTADEFYHKNTYTRVMKEIKQHFETYNRFFFIVVDKSNKNKFSAADIERIERHLSADRKDSSALRKHLSIRLQDIVFRERGGEIIYRNSLDRYSKDAITTEFAHSFGLNRDYRSPSYLMSYNEQSKHLSKSSAAWLNKSQFFNSENTYFDDKTVIGKFSRSRGKARFKVEDADGIYQVRLLVQPTNEKPPPGFLWKKDPTENKTEWEKNFKGKYDVLHEVLTLNGEKMATVELDYPKFADNMIEIHVIDEIGNRVYMIVDIRGNPLEYFLQSILD